MIGHTRSSFMSELESPSETGRDFYTFEDQEEYAPIGENEYDGEVEQMARTIQQPLYIDGQDPVYGEQAAIEQAAGVNKKDKGLSDTMKTEYLDDDIDGGYGDDVYEDEEWASMTSTTPKNNSSKANGGGKPASNPDLTGATSGQGGVAGGMDYDSFIVEDNDEGVDSLTATPYLPPYSTNTSKEPVFISQRVDVEYEKPPLTPRHLQEYIDYASHPMNFIDILLHEAMYMERWHSLTNTTNNSNGNSPNGESKATNTNGESPILNSFSFILANSSSNYEV